MFSEDFSIFIGPSGNGKTTLLHRMAYEAYNRLGMRIAFLGLAEGEFSEHFMKKRYDLVRYIGYTDSNNRLALELISELCRDGRIDMIFIDDIDMFMSTDPMARQEYVSILESIPAKKAATCSSFPFIDESYDYTIGSFRCHSLACEHSARKNLMIGGKHHSAWDYQVDGEEQESFINSLIRDKKINDILK